MRCQIVSHQKDVLSVMKNIMNSAQNSSTEFVLIEFRVEILFEMKYKTYRYRIFIYKCEIMLSDKNRIKNVAGHAGHYV
jgi:hypothetical protein